jgi:hypothetical protein
MDGIMHLSYWMKYELYRKGTFMIVFRGFRRRFRRPLLYFQYVDVCTALDLIQYSKLV